MKREIELACEFVDHIPEVLSDQKLYISMTYATAVHKCCCGCGREVVTPLSPTGWQLTFDGKSVSLRPSIGSWSLPCQSHYSITNSTVMWEPRWTKQQIANGHAHEAKAKEMFFTDKRESLSRKIKRWLS